MASVSSNFSGKVYIYKWGPLVTDVKIVSWFQEFVGDLDEMDLKVKLDMTTPSSYDYDGVGTVGYAEFSRVPCRVRQLYRRDTTAKDGHWIAESIMIHLPKSYGICEESIVIWDGFEYDVLKVAHLEAFGLDKVMALRERKQP